MSKKYEQMRVEKLTTILEEGILSGSIFDESAVRSVGQETRSINFSGDDFYHEWGSSATY